MSIGNDFQPYYPEKTEPQNPTALPSKKTSSVPSEINPTSLMSQPTPNDNSLLIQGTITPKSPIASSSNQVASVSSSFWGGVEEEEACETLDYFEKEYGTKMGVQLFRDVEFPVANPDKNIFCFLVNNLTDGVGDFAHALDFLEKSRPFLNAKGYIVMTIVTAYIDETNPDSAESKRGRYVLEAIKTAATDDYLIFIGHPDESLTLRGYEPITNETRKKQREWLDQNKQKLQTLKYHTAGAIEISTKSPSFISRNVLPGVSIIKCHQYGSGSSTDDEKVQYFEMESVPMGSLDSEREDGFGIKIIKDRPYLSPEDRLLELEHTEPEFVRSLLGTESPTKENAKNYLNSHFFMPGYIQSEYAAITFIFIQFLRYRDQIFQGKRCDFFLTGCAINPDLMSKLLQVYGLESKDVAFITDPSSTYPSEAKLRIFSFRINDANAYNSLYFLTGDGAAASGDNSISLAFSGRHIPWYQFKDVNPIQSFYDTELYHFVRELTLDQDVRGNPLVKKGVSLFVQYINLLNRLVYKKEDLIAVVDLLKQPELQIGWDYILSQLKKLDYYKRLPDVIKSSILLTSLSNKEIAKYIRRSARVEGLLESDAISEEELNEFNYKFIGYITSQVDYMSNIYYFKTSIRAIYAVFPTPPFPDNYKLNRIFYASKKLGDEELATLFKSPIFLITQFFELIPRKWFFQNSDFFLTHPEEDWWPLIVKKIDPDQLSNALSIAYSNYYIPGNTQPFEYLLSMINTYMPDHAENILEKFYNKHPESINDLVNNPFTPPPKRSRLL